MSLDTNYRIILEGLKERIRVRRQKAALAVTNELLSVYWEIGNTILHQQKIEKWGAKVIDRLAADLKIAFPDMKGLSSRNLIYMRSFAEAWPHFMQQPAALRLLFDNESFIIAQQLAAQLPWGHHQLLLDKVKDARLREFYVLKTRENDWSRSVLLHQIDNQLHLRQGNAITNFSVTLPNSQSDLAMETFKNPYIFDFLTLSEEIQERELEKALTQHIKKFVQELGRGFAYVGNQYNLKVENDDYFLDLFFFNYLLNRFVVFELKVGEFKPEFTGKLNFYINTVDAQIKLPNHQPTIGILLCKTPNETIVKYALKGVDTPMGVAEFELTSKLPKKLKTELPTIEELEEEIEKETIEFKNQNPVEARLQSLKGRLKTIKADEIKTLASYQILQDLFRLGLKSLYQSIIDKLFKEFHEEFVSQSVYWQCNNQIVHGIEDVEAFWKKEENLRSNKAIEFSYQLHGFRKAGPEDFSEYLTLKFEWREYWWGLSLLNHKNNEPFIKKMYHQAMTNEDKQLVIDLLITKIMDKIDWILEVMKEKSEKSEV
jgi:predicted nuclease of restriction endonuclease-like (RecB) superfamily